MSITAAEVVERVTQSPCDAASIESAAAIVVAGLLAAFPAGGVSQVSIGIGGAGAVAEIVVVGTRTTAAAVPYAQAVVRAAVAQDASTLQSELERIRAEQALTAQSALATTDVAGGAEGALFAAVQTWGNEPAPVALDGFDVLINPESGRGVATSSLAAVSNYRGGSYSVPRELDFNRIAFNCSAFTSQTNTIVALYQRPDGFSGASYPLVAVFRFDVTAAAAVQATRIDAATNARLVPGLMFALWGRENAGVASMIVVNNPAVPGKDATPMPPAAHPWAFLTAIPVTTTPPASFDPVAAATPTTTSVALEIRLQRV